MYRCNQFYQMIFSFAKIIRIFCCVFIHFRRDNDRRVYHLVSSAEIKVSWKEMIECGHWIVCNKLPLNGVVWYPGGSMKSSRLQHKICCILFQWIPAILIDCLLFCLRYPPMWALHFLKLYQSMVFCHYTQFYSYKRLCRVQRRIQKGFDVFEYYANNQWDFSNNNVLYLRTIINDIEAKRYAIEDKGMPMKVKQQIFETITQIKKKISILQQSICLNISRIAYTRLVCIFWRKVMSQFQLLGVTWKCKHNDFFWKIKIPIFCCFFCCQQNVLCGCIV